MIYFILDEPFSAYTGLALSSTVANIMRFEENSVVVCPHADSTWGFSPNRIRVIRALSFIAWVRGWRFVPLAIRRQLLSRICASVLSEIRPGDIVWFHNWQYIAEALELGIRAQGARLIYHCHNSHALYARRTKFRFLTPDAMIFNSEAMRQEVLHLLPGLHNTHTVYNGADDTLLYPLDPGSRSPTKTPVILFVGRLVPYKGVHVLIDAMRILEKRGVDAVCRVVGSFHAGGSRTRMTAYIRSVRTGCPPNVHFEGFRAATDIAKDYRAADILCCPSIWQEPFGNVNIEAMASGIPVVASRVGGIPEIAAEGGIVLVEPNSAVELADALQKLILDRKLRLKVGAEGLASFRKRFTWSAICRQHRKLIEGLQEGEMCA